MMKRWNNTIKEIDFIENAIVIHTFSILWMPTKDFSISYKDIKIKNSIFIWYGKEHKNGLTISFGRNNLYFVSDYFDDSDNIIKNLSLKLAQE